MINRVFTPDESAFTRISLTNIVKIAKPGQTTRIFALLTMLVMVSCSAALADPTSPIRGLHDLWGKTNPLSRLHDGQPRPDANTQGTPYTHESKPAPDRTKLRDYRLIIELERQRKKNTPGGPTGNKGYENYFNQEKPNYPNVPARNGPYAKAAISVGSMVEQIGGAPQQGVNSAITDMQGQMQGAGDAMQNANIRCLEDYIPMLLAGNINVANEAAGSTSINTRAPFRPVSEAIGMVQQMYHHVYVPMALLLLLPGAILLQMKIMLSQFATQDEDSQGGPLGHILRGMIALFLIPSTQLIMSYSIDVGNSMTYAIGQQFAANEIVQWAAGQQQAKEAQGQPVDRMDPQEFKDQTMQMAAGMINMSMGIGLLILAAFQLGMSCYLFLMGPIAAALYAWPGSVGRLFKPVFINWVNATVTISLWRFWWILIVFVMVTRLSWLREIGEYVPNTQWEALMLGCFMVMMMYVPFAPFELKPGELVDRLMEKAKEANENGAGGGKKGGSPHNQGRA
ncbi:MAG: hypothetical protein C0507_14755 [Cyanobacteria bacterium PR.3.49]|jgi:hypothetical protein|nr:hypothetical protein [Cyanobacteria bacterium PR.3.49]